MKELLEQFNIETDNLKLYWTAFSHSSYTHEHHVKEDYERLEFLGDAIVDLVVADYLFNNKHIAEGDMTKIRASYVCENALYRYSTDLGLTNYIKVGNGEQKANGNHKKAIVADIFESFVAAIYLDKGFDKVKEVILTIIVPYIENPSITFFSDYKSALQEFVQTEARTVVYSLIKEEGPAHNKTFTVKVSIDNITYGIGEANSKKEAEQEAAQSALEKLAH